MALCINLLANKEAIELILKIAVAIGGAVWAYYLLGALRQRELARVAEVKGTAETERLRIELRTLAAEKEIQLEKYTREIRKLDQENEQLKRTLERKTIIVIDMKHEVAPNRDGKGFIVYGVVELTNQGNLDTRIPWYEQDPAIKMSQVRFDADGQPKFGYQTEAHVRSTRDPNLDASAHVVRSGGKEVIVFALHAPVEGLYLLSFRAKGKPFQPEQAGSADAGPVESSQTARAGTGALLPWTSNKYILVGGASVPGAAAVPGAAMAEP